MIDNANAIKGIKEILRKFSDVEVLSVCGTVTQGLLKNKIHTRDGAIEAIIKYSTDSTSFLKRKAITRNHLFDYLHEADIEVTLPITKDELIDAILRHWNDNRPRSHSSSSNSLSITSCDDAVDANAGDSIQETQIATTSNRSDDQFQSNHISINELETMALKFTEWFYSLMNQNEMIGIEHFYPDASIEIGLINDQVTVTESAVNDASEVVGLLFKIKHEHNLYFNPNLHKDGTKARMDPHGLVIIMSCGTLHINNIISGVFEQMFGLARDPFSDNNWKIKSSKLVLRSKSNVDAMPRLCDGEMLQIKDVS